jgi:hypothetical protein
LPTLLLSINLANSISMAPSSHMARSRRLVHLCSRTRSFSWSSYRLGLVQPAWYSRDSLTRSSSLVRSWFYDSLNSCGALLQTGSLCWCGALMRQGSLSLRGALTGVGLARLAWCSLTSRLCCGDGRLSRICPAEPGIVGRATPTRRDAGIIALKKLPRPSIPRPRPPAHHPRAILVVLQPLR